MRRKPRQGLLEDGGKGGEGFNEEEKRGKEKEGGEKVRVLKEREAVRFMWYD